MAPRDPVMRSFQAMGTRFECVLGAFNRPITGAEATSIGEEIERLVLDWHDLLSVFDPASRISAINAAGPNRATPLPPDLFDLLRRSVAYGHQTGSAFDIGIGSLMASHGFRAEQTVATDWGADAIELDDARCSARLTRHGIVLDLGAIAKGFVLDLCRAELRELGVTSALLHGGASSVTAIGSAPDGQPWRVLAWPDDPDAPTVELNDGALSVSAPSGRISGAAGHIIDPRTGHPAAGVTAACAFGPSAETCEVWSTALVVDPSLCAQLPAGYGAHIRTDDGWSSADESRICSASCS